MGCEYREINGTGNDYRSDTDRQLEQCRYQTWGNMFKLWDDFHEQLLKYCKGNNKLYKYDEIDCIQLLYCSQENIYIL